MTKKKAAPRGTLIYGINPICELLKAKRRKLIVLYTTKPTPRSFDTIKRLLPPGVQTQFVGRDVLERMAGSAEHQSVVAWVGDFPTTKQIFDPKKHPFILLLDGVQDPRNLGAILRSAYCTGADGVVLPKKQSAPLSGTVFKSSAGLAEHLLIHETPTAASAAQQLKQAGYTLYLAALDGESPDAHTYDGPTCLVIGSEGTGISPAILKLGPHITIEQRSPTISYNASVAAGILLHTIGKKKGVI